MTKPLREKFVFLLAVFCASGFGYFSPSLAQTKPTLPVALLNNTYTDSLIRVYVLLEGTGATTTDYSTYNSSGTISGAAWSSDAEGNLLQFTPIDAPDYVIDNDETGLSKISGDLTIIVRFKYNSLLQGRVVIGRTVTTGTTNTYDWIVYLQGAINRPDLCFDTDAIAATCFGNTAAMTLVLGNWYTFAATYSNTVDSVRLYLDGVLKHSALVGSGGGNIVSNTGRKFMLGRYGAAKTAVIDMHYAYVWNRKLSDAEIATLYSEPYEHIVEQVPEISVTGNSAEIVDEDTTPSLSDSTDFDSLGIGQSRSVTYTILNNGSDPLVLSGAPKVAVAGTHASDFTVTTQPSSPVAASGTTTFVVKFTPSATGVRSATLSIANDDANENPYNFSIQGTGAESSTVSKRKYIFRRNQ